MSELLRKAYDPQTFREQGQQLLERLTAYLSQSLNKEDIPVLAPGEPEKYWKEWKENPPPLKLRRIKEKEQEKGYQSPFEGGNRGMFLKGQEKVYPPEVNEVNRRREQDQQPESTSDFLKLFEAVIQGANHLHHPRYAGHQVVPPLPLAALAELVSDLLNNGMAIYEMGPSGTVIEREVIEWLGRKCGYTEPGGVLTSGGTAGNLTAMLAARQQMLDNNPWVNGYPQGVTPAIMVSEQAHYSMSRAARIMGLGDQGIILLPADSNFRIDTTALPQLLIDARNEGKQVISIIGSAGTTATGTYDDLEALAEFAEQNHLWFHVDGAHGGPVIFSEKYKHLARGMERADSIVIDFHKMMLTPALTTAVLYKNSKHSYEVFSQKADYLLGEDDEPWYDSAMRTLECTKKMMGLKVYAIRKMYGDKIFDDYISGRYDIAREFAALVNQRKDWETAVNPDSNILCFRYVPEGMPEDEVNRLNASIRKKFREDGRFYIVKTSLRGKIYLRITVMNPFTGLEEMKEILDMAEAFAG